MALTPNLFVTVYINTLYLHTIENMQNAPMLRCFQVSSILQSRDKTEGLEVEGWRPGLHSFTSTRWASSCCRFAGDQTHSISGTRTFGTRRSVSRVHLFRSKWFTTTNIPTQMMGWEGIHNTQQTTDTIILSKHFRYIEYRSSFSCHPTLQTHYTSKVHSMSCACIDCMTGLI